MRYRGWSKVFERASDRCRALDLEVFATPHILRHFLPAKFPCCDWLPQGE